MINFLCSSALAGVDRSGRGFNPRPSQGLTGNGKIRPVFGGGVDEFGVLGKCLVGGSAPALCRSGVEPPTGKLHPREGIGQTTENRNQLND